jgi:hypothetical protein
MDAYRSRPDHVDPPRHRRASGASVGERGVAMIVALFFTIVVLGLTMTGSLLLRSHQEHTEISFVANSQAVRLATSGLTETVGWLRKQTAQPVTSFQPVLDTAAVPPILDTIDPAIGIVREFRISGAVWGRYEVWKDWPADPDPTRLAFRNLMRIEDISQARQMPAAGSVWRLRSIGYVFRRVDASAAFDELPNHVLSQQVIEVEARRLALMLPGEAALNVDTGSTTAINVNGRVVGGTGGGIFYPSGTGAPSYVAGSVTGGIAAATPPENYNGSYEAVFGLPLPDLRTIASLVITDPADFPSPIPAYSLIIVEAPSIAFDLSRPLKGTGVVVVVGNVTVLPGSNSNFSGLLYVDGNLTVRAPAEIQGSVVCTGSVTVQGSPDYATITYDDGILNALRHELGNYRQSGAYRRPLVQDH